MQTKKHDVTLYALVRVKVANVDAPDHQTAIEKSEKAVDLHKLFDRDLVPGGALPPDAEMGAVYTAYAEDIVNYLVDEHGDPDYLRSRTYDGDRRPIPAEKGAGKADASR